jgi:energy-coupling factor transporter transmembrane protein EcfT
MLRLFIIGFILYILTAFTPDHQLNSGFKSLRKELPQINSSVNHVSEEITAPFNRLYSHPSHVNLIPFFSK